MPLVLREKAVTDAAKTPIGSDRGRSCIDRSKQETGVRVAPRCITRGIRLARHRIREVEGTGGSEQVLIVDPVAIDFHAELHGVLAADPADVLDDGITQIVPILVISAAEILRRDRAAAEADGR